MMDHRSFDRRGAYLRRKFETGEISAEEWREARSLRLDELLIATGEATAATLWRVPIGLRTAMLVERP